MIYRPSQEDLQRQGLIKRCRVDQKAIENLLGRAEIDLKTAARNLDDDPECTHTYAYPGVAAIWSSPDAEQWLSA